MVMVLVVVLDRKAGTVPVNSRKQNPDEVIMTAESNLGTQDNTHLCAMDDHKAGASLKHKSRHGPGQMQQHASGQCSNIIATA